jgi:hypothetical protein
MTSANSSRPARVARAKVSHVAPEIASAAAALPADLFADIVGETKKNKEAAKIKRQAKKSAPLVKLTAQEVENLNSVKWGLPRVGDSHTVEFKIVTRHYETDLSTFYDRVADIVKANGSLKLSDIARGYSMVVKAAGRKPSQEKYHNL